MQQLSFNFDKQPEEMSGLITLEDMFKAYYDCRLHKRSTANALAFELDYERKLVRLCQQINDNTYTVGRSIAFVVDKPVKREIFAADFRDRVVHHLLINKTGHLFEKEFIYDSYSCRKGKGTLFGVKRVSRFIRSCSENYTKDCYILKMDLQGFFMSIDRRILFNQIHELIGCNYHEPDRDIMIRLAEQIIMNDCIENAYIKSSPRKWDGLPQNKSLFGNDAHKGLPIGNYTSQVFANYYLNSFDHFIKSELRIRYYGRYVDDFVLIHPDKSYLKSLIPVIENYLQTNLGLNIHPKKIVLQHYSKGVRFTGAYIMPDRIYIERRTKGNFYQLIDRWNKRIRDKDERELTQEEIFSFITSANSYLGFMKHYKTYKLRKKMLSIISAKFDPYFVPANKYNVLKQRKNK